MPRRWTPFASALVVALSGCRHTQPNSVAGAGDASGAAIGNPAAPRQPVVVAIVVDQLAAWVAAERLPLLPKDGGFARVQREGTWARDMRYAHSATDTAPGHAALFTGAVPRDSGIWTNEVFEPTTHERVSILRDDATKLVSTTDLSDQAGASSRALTIESVADRLRTAHPDATILSFSIKDRGAIFAGGRHPTAAIWYDKKLDRFVTSTAFASAFPKWATPLAEPKEMRKSPWVPLDAAWVKRNAATDDAQDGEGELGGMSITFPHDIVRAPSPPIAFRGSPFADDALFGLALAGLDGEHAGEHPTFLSVSLSANDYIGHTYGPDSWEAWDELYRLDASLARFFAALDARFTAAGWSLLLTADHGTTTMPETTRTDKRTRPWCMKEALDRWERACGIVGRLMPVALGDEVGVAARAAVPAPKGEAWVSGIIDPYVYLTPGARALGAPEAKRLRSAIVAALLRHPEVDRVLETRALPKECPAEKDESIDALVCRSFVPGLGGDLYIVPKRGSFFDPTVVIGKGTSHGSPYLYDRAVPLLARAPGRVAAGTTSDEPISFRTFTRTLATLLGVEPPDTEAARAADLAHLR